MTIDAYTALILALRSGMPLPVHNKILNRYFNNGTDLIQAVSFFMNESESQHLLHTYVGGIPTSNSAKLLSIELIEGPFVP